MGLDIRTVNCSCNSKLCKTGIRFDSEPPVLIFQDKFCQDHIMKLSKKNITLLINELKSIKNNIK